MVPILFLRREGDSNPRYSYPYDSLANCWFQPLTHLTKPLSVLRLQIYKTFFISQNKYFIKFALKYKKIYSYGKKK